MKKIGILTFHTAMNYGAILQTYALYHTIASMGYMPVIINRQATTIFSGKWKAILRYILIKVLPLKICSFHKRFLMAKRFDIFSKKNLPNKTFPSFSSQQLKRRHIDIDCVVAGSDQIWNYNLSESQSPGMGLDMFVGFLPERIKRVSYAASFGTAKWNYDTRLTAEINALLCKFSAISVRENSGIDICDKVFKLKAETVLDPTLLLSPRHYDKLIQDSMLESTPYILIFKFNWDDGFCNMIEALSNKTTLPICSINSKRESNHYRSVYSPTVEQWLAYIKNAHLVITDSFHALSFSIIYNKPFVVLNNGIPERMDRQTDLLKSLGINDRCLSYEDVVNNIGSLMKLSYSEVNKRLALKQKKSIDFLKRSLQ